MFRFGHYEVLETSDGNPVELGRGAMGITYKALDTALQRAVALKVINPDTLAGDAARQRFLREARAAAQLKHPNVASVFHLGEDGGTHYYAMEFIEGETLESLVQRTGPLSCGFALDITGQVAAALAAADAANLVHRDIKPANLMIVQDADGKNTVKVIDFGLAKTSGHSGVRDATITVSGFLGTPHFASPEQLEEKEIDIRSDIYSLGATLWHMLTGRTLFSGSLVRVMIGQISETPPFDRLAAPPEMIALLRAMLAKDPAQRPQTPGELLTLIHQTEQIVAPEIICGAADLNGENWTGFTLQELLRVRRELPLREVLVILRRLAETLDAIGSMGASAIDLRIHSVAIDFVKPPTASPQDSMLLSISEWPAFNFKFRNIDSVGKMAAETSSAEETLLAPAPATHTGNYVQRLGSLVYELLGGKLRADADFVPLAALSEGGNTALKKALIPAPADAYRTGLEFHTALENADSAEISLLQPTAAQSSQQHPLQIVRSTVEMPRDLALAAPLRKRRPVFGTVLALALLAAVAGASALWIHHGSPKTFAGLKQAALEDIGRLSPALASKLSGDNPEAKPSAAHSPTSAPAPKIAQASVHPSPTPVRVSTPAPTPQPTREQRLKLALEEKTRFETAGDSLNVLASAIKLAKGFPEYDSRLAHLDETILKLRDTGVYRHEWRSFAPAMNEAADFGSGPAMLIVGEHLRKNQPDRALALFRTAADKGVGQAMTEVGLMYLHAQGVAPDAREAEKWFDKARDAGDPNGLCILAECCLTGRAVKQDNAKGVQLLLDAAVHRSGDAKNLLGKIHLYGLAGLPASKSNAIEFFREAKELNCPEAFYNLGMMNLNSHGPTLNPGRAAVLFRHGAELGDAPSMFYYGKCLEEGIGVPVSKSDATQWYVKAADLLKKEADEGSRVAMVCYALCLENGKGIERDPTGTSKYYARAASLGDPGAGQWCNEHHIIFRPNVAAPGQGLLFLPHNLAAGAATPAKAP